MANPWVSIDATSDRRERAATLAAARESALAGTSPPKGAIRRVISASWRRSSRAGVDAESGLAPVALGAGEAQSRWDQHPVAASMPAGRELLRDVGTADHQVLLFCDADGTLLWIDGERRVVHRARDVRLEPGTLWSEAAAGTNAMGTALQTGHPVQVFSAEHYARPVHGWTCSAAPIRDPESGRTVGVLDLSGGIETAHPHSLAVVTAAAQLVEQQLRISADTAAARLVETYGGRIGSGAARPDALATAAGRVLLSADEALIGGRLALSDPDLLSQSGGVVALPGGRTAVAEPVLDGGFLLWIARDGSDERELGESAGKGELRLEALGRDGARLTIDGVEHLLSPRHSELLALLSLRPGGWSAEQLADELLGAFGKAVSIRAEFSRLRRILGRYLASHPYTLNVGLSTDYSDVERHIEAGRLREALDGFRAGELLPGSDAPVIVEARFRLTMSLREAVIAAADPDLLSAWLRTPAGDDDAQACRVLMAMCPPADSRHALAAGRLRRLSGAR
jgi:hypothetical protein